jgi:mannose-1-phosphate guanylyltransferase
MLEEAVRRIEPLVGSDSVAIATTPMLRQPVLDAQLVPPARVLTEPDKRNTLGALVWAVAHLLPLGDDTQVAVLTADHKIGDPEAFRATVDQALQIASERGGIVCLGIRPTRPETGYGYIEFDVDEPVHIGAQQIGFRSIRFREKPDADLAREFVQAGRFLWNSGMFFFTIGSFVSELDLACPPASQALREIANALQQGDDLLALEAFRSLPNLSIDYALLEKAATVHVVPATFPWDDLGAWDALERSLPTDGDDNVVVGEVLALDCEGSIIYNDNAEQKVALVGVSDLVVVITPDAVLVCPKDRAQEVKRIVGSLSPDSRSRS